MLSRAEREDRARSIRALLLEYLNRTHNRRNEAVREIPRELVEVKKQLDLLVKLETPAGQQEKRAS